MKEHILKKVFSRNFLLPLVAMGLVFAGGLIMTDHVIYKMLVWSLCVLATGYNGLGAINQFIKGKNGKKNEQ